MKMKTKVMILQGSGWELGPSRGGRTLCSHLQPGYRGGVAASEDGELRLEDNQLEEWRATAGTEHSVRELNYCCLVS